MPTNILNQSEREAYEQLPTEIDDFSRIQFFHLTEPDKYFIRSFYGSLHQTAIALQIGIIRWLGYLPDGWKGQLPTSLFTFVTNQLGVTLALQSLQQQYGSRDKTRTKHLQAVLLHLDFRKWRPMDELLLEPWLLQQGMEHDNERWLLDTLCEKLHRDKILRPALGTLERIVGSVREELHIQTYRRMEHLCSEALTQKLDLLLDWDPIRKSTLHRWLCTPPTTNTPRAINQTLEKIIFLQSLSVPDWDLSALPANRRKRLAAIARSNTNQYLGRIPPVRRHPILLCFLWESLLDITDTVISMFDAYWEHMVNGAKKALEQYQLGLVESHAQAMQLLTRAVEMLIDEQIEDNRLREMIFQALPKPQLQQALTLARANLKSSQSYLYFLGAYYPTLKQFTPNLLKALTFQVAFTKDYFETALVLVKDLQTGKKRKLPDYQSPNNQSSEQLGLGQLPTQFITPSWEKLIFTAKNPLVVNQQAYELCVLATLHDRLSSGDVFVSPSRKYADFNTFLLPAQRWEAEKNELCQGLGGSDLALRLDQRIAELESLLEPLEQLLEKGTEIRLEEGVLVVPPLSAENIPDSAKALQEQINRRLPKVNLSEMIREVDDWLGYCQCLQPVGGTARHPAHQSLLYAALFADGCNVPLSDLSRSSELDYQSLWWVSSNYLTDENLKQATNLLVNFHHGQWLSSYWGGGTLSSSDGQRFPTSGKIRNARSQPKYFGYGKGVTFYTHTSDQYSQFGSKVIVTTERDATYVLDEINDNQTDLPLLEHTTDTSGYSDLLFAFFDLSGRWYAPRLRDIKDQRLCRVKGKEWSYPGLKFTATVNPDYIRRHWDPMLRVAASIKTGTVTASLLISKLQSYPRQNNLTYVLQSYGQLVKTIFICRYLLELPLRRKINTQLIKGEQLHNLRLYLWFGGDGFIRKKQSERQQVTARSLNLLTNVVLVWNTVYIQAILKQLQKEGFAVNEEDFEHLSPAPFEHINRLGKYSFWGKIEVAEDGLRPLRQTEN